MQHGRQLAFGERLLDSRISCLAKYVTCSCGRNPFLAVSGSQVMNVIYNMLYSCNKIWTNHWSSTVLHLFEKRRVYKLPIVHGRRRYSEDLPQGGLEIPCRLVFEGEARSERHYYINLIRAVIIQISKYS